MTTNDLQEQLVTYLKDAHALEQNALAQLKTGVETAGSEPLRQVFREHLAETEEHDRLISERLESHAESPSKLKELAQKGGAIVAGLAAKAVPDTTGKLATQAYAFEHAEIASYRMLCVVAQRAGDQQTLEVARRILAQEQQVAHKLDGLLEQVAELDLDPTAPRVRRAAVAGAKFVVYKDEGGKSRWRLVSPNGQITASSGQHFASHYDARRAAEHVKQHAATAEIVED